MAKPAAGKKSSSKPAKASAARKSAAAKPSTTKAVARKNAPPRLSAPKAAARGKALEPPSSKSAAEKPPAGKKPATRRDPSLGPVQKTRIVFPKDWYEAHKDEIKAPFKLHGLKWNYLGEGKGLYKREKEVHCFAQFLDDGTHYSLWGDDKKACEEILKAWRTLAGEPLYSKFTASGEAASQAEAEVKESEALRLWKLGEPQPRAGEPDFFFKKRHAEWVAKKPSA